MSYTDPDGLETVAAWRCVESCPVRRLGEQSGVRKSGGADGHRRASPNLCMSGPNTERVTTGGMGPSSGTAARFFH